MCSLRWNGAKILGSDGPYQCSRREMNGGTFLAGGRRPLMCIRPYPDVVSSFVRDHGHWLDCPVLADWWDALPCPPDKPGCSKNVYLDIGANIGACLLPMVARPDIQRAYAFEPSRSNLYYLTNSIRLNPSTSKKVWLWPAGLGKVRSSFTLWEEPGNAGNSAIGARTAFNSRAVGQVEVITLDSVLMAGPEAPPYIHMAKMDTQGFEGKVLQGATELLKSGVVTAWKFEVTSWFLQPQGTTVTSLFNMFIDTGYVIYEQSGVPVSQSMLRHYACFRTERDFVASRVPPRNLLQWRGRPERQRRVEC